MLYTGASERRSREAVERRDQLTLIVANGVAVAFNKDARAAFDRSRPRHVEAPTAREQKATLGRLAAMFPANVKLH